MSDKDLPIELQHAISPYTAGSVLSAADRLRSIGIEPSAVMMQLMPGLDIDDQPASTFVDIPVVWSRNPGIRLIIDIV